MKHKSLLLFNLLSWIERGESRQTMCKLLNFSNQRLQWHISSLKAKGLIEEVQNKPISLYRLTPLGNRIKEMSTQSDTNFYTCWRVHNLIVGWEVKGWGSWKFNPTFLKDMKNFKFQELVLKGHKIHIQDSGLIKIYCPEVYAANADDGFDRAVQEASKVAEYIASKYDMQLGERYRIRSGHKEKIGSEKIGEFLGHLKIGGVWVDASTGSRRLEADQDNYDLEKLLAMPNIIENKLIPAIEQHSHDIQLHLSVLNEMRDAIRELRDAVRGFNAR